jgi:hypothetical protein
MMGVLVKQDLLRGEVVAGRCDSEHPRRTCTVEATAVTPYVRVDPADPCGPPHQEYFELVSWRAGGRARMQHSKGGVEGVQSA